MARRPRISGRTVNEILQALALEYGVSIERLKSSEVRKVLDLLAEVDEELLAKLSARLTRLGPVETQLFGAGRYTTERLQRLRDSLKEIADRSYQTFYERLKPTLEGVALNAAAFEAEALNRTIQAVAVQFETATVSAATLRAIVRERPIDGKLLEPFVRDWSETKRALVEQEIRKGLVSGETIPQIVKRVRGPEAFVRSRRSAEAIVRTSVASVMNASREAVWEANADVIKGIRWSSTLDSRTCVICASLDGKVYDMNAGPRPPAHANCRCATVAVTVASNIPGARASEFGPVPRDQSFGDFLKERGAVYQDDVLGPARGALFRKGGLDLTDFVDKSGRPFSLDELRRRNAEAFTRAGL